ncbi:MAG TPA: 50S ribosomal protein L3 [Candidatus Omnitrophota bacterium]|nr:50S ribosomal protein L3 [Candidatus Omnitrophota bacterium]
MLGILGKKIGMTTVFDEQGKNTPITVIEAGPCQVLQVKTSEADGYSAVQLGFGQKKEKHTTKAQMGRFKKAGIASPLRFIKEIRVKDPQSYKAGQTITADIFAKGDYLDVVGVSIGRGFQGGVRRWGWAGGDDGHGSMFHRAIGSIQSGARLSRVTKGHHMPGHMGVDRITVQNLEIVDVIKDKNLVLVKGCIPGHINSFVILKEARKRPKGYIKPKYVPTAAKKGAAKAGGAKKK